MGNKNNTYWSRAGIENHIKHDNPDISEEEAKQLAKTIHKELNKLNSALKRNNDKYYSKVCGYTKIEEENIVTGKQIGRAHV